MNRDIKQIIFPILILIFCAWYGYLSTLLRSREYAPGASELGPGFMPVILAILTAAISLIELISNIKRHKQGKQGSADEVVNKTELVRNGIAVSLFIVFIFLMPKFGFLIMTIFFVASLILVIGEKSLIRLTTIPLVVAFFFYFVFKILLRVPLP